MTDESKVTPNIIPTEADSDVPFKLRNDEWYCDHKSCKTERGINTIDTCKRDHIDQIYKMLSTGQLKSKIGIPCKFRDISTSHEHKTILSRVTVIQTAAKQSFEVARFYVCDHCGRDNIKRCDDFREIYDKDMIEQCSTCGEGTCFIDKNRTMSAGIQKVMFQEQVRGGVLQPVVMEANLYGCDIDTVQAGREYQVNFIVRTEHLSKGNVTKFVLDVLNIESLNEQIVEDPTSFESSLFREMDLSKIAESLEPKIYNRTEEKTALLLSMLSGERQEGERMELNMLMVGNPGTGKSQLLKFCNELDNRTKLISGRSTSRAGMVMGMDTLSDGTKMVTFGPVVMANNSYIAIDELDKMNPEDSSALHDVMELGVANFNKVGVDIHMPVRTRILGAANPKKSSWDDNKTIMDNINMDDSFISRFGFVFKFVNEFSLEQKKQKRANDSYIRMNGLESFIAEKGLLTKIQLMKYIKVAKTFDPKPTVESLDRIDEIMDSFESEKQDKDSIALDDRTAKDFYRMTYAIARFCHSDKIAVEHVDMARTILFKAYRSFGMNTPQEFQDVQLSKRTALSDIFSFDSED